MRKFWRRDKTLRFLAVCGIIVIFSAQASETESVHAVLTRLQEEKGLTLAWVDNQVLVRSQMTHTTVQSPVQAVSFKTRTLVPLKDSLQAFRLEGFSFDDIPKLAAVDLCWSHDGRKVAATMLHPPKASLEVFTPETKVTLTIEEETSWKMHFTSQCWSPNDKQVAFESDGNVKTYQISGDTQSVRVLARGTDVTWSPDGTWIAFRDRDTYYAIHPDGKGRKKLFHNYWGGAVSALYWSPDSLIVAYVRELGFLQGGALDAEVYQLRVRRLGDGSEDWLCSDSVDWYANYHWITSGELMTHRSSNPR
jgi:WD40-like Beta Propeller Repeat